MSFKLKLTKLLFPEEYNRIIDLEIEKKKEERYLLITKPIDEARMLDDFFTKNKRIKKIISEYLNSIDIESLHNFASIKKDEINRVIRNNEKDFNYFIIRLDHFSDIDSKSVINLKSTNGSIRYIFDLIHDYYIEYVNFCFPYSEDAVEASSKMKSILEEACNKQSEYFDMEKERALKLKEDSIFEFRKELVKHMAVLSRKRRSLQYRDDYGFLVNNVWIKEKKSFLSNFALPTFWNYHYIEDGLPIIDVELDEYDSLNKYVERNIEFDEQMNPYDYELMCSEIMKKQGWESSVTKGSGDQGVDVVAEKNDIKLVMQCKRFNQPVGNFAVQEIFAGAGYYEASHSIVVTNNTFTPSARRLASKLNVFLLHHDDLHNIDSILCSGLNYNPIDG